MTNPGRKPVDAHAIATLAARQAGSGEPYLEFLRRESFSVGLYVISAGAPDTQQPHTEDEVYFVLEGHARLWTSEGAEPVRSGSVVFVQAGLEHRFEAVESDLKVLVFFAPAEGSAGTRE